MIILKICLEQARMNPLQMVSFHINSAAGGGFNFNQVPKQLYYTTLKKTNKFDSNSLGNGVSESNFPNKNKKFHDFDDEFLTSNSSTANIRGSGIQGNINYSNNNNGVLSQSMTKKEKIGSDNNTVKPTFNIANLEEKENSPGRTDKNLGKNRLKSALKFIEESFDIKKETNQNPNNKLDINSSFGTSSLPRDRTMGAKKDSALKFVEENMLFNEKTKENSPPRYIPSTFTKKADVPETGEYEFESRRKKR
jgi:hypothetical protein